MIRSYNLDDSTLLKLSKIINHFKENSDKPFLVNKSSCVRYAINHLYNSLFN